ncbi:MAG: hypothetical protein KF776_01145 [Burkholderiales bacterium]|nr:hypothetical protein [Burkholderiales bacterium]
MPVSARLALALATFVAGAILVAMTTAVAQAQGAGPAEDAAACPACEGFAQAARMLRQVVEALEREIEKSREASHRITNRILDEQRRETPDEKAELERLGRHMQRIVDEILPAWREQLRKMRETLKSCNETHCRPGAPPPPPPTQRGLGDLMEVAGILFDMDTDWDDERDVANLRYLSRARCPECKPFEDRVTKAREKIAGIRAEVHKIHDRRWELLGIDPTNDLQYQRERLQRLDDRGVPKDSPERVELENRINRDAQRRREIREELRSLKRRLEELAAERKDAEQEWNWAMDDLDRCNRERCQRGGVRVGSVTPLGGTNPFDPNSPIGVAGGTPPVQPPADGPGAVQFASPAFSGGEGGAVAVIVVRTVGAKGAVAVTYASASGTATSGADFAPASGTLSWADGDASARTISIALTDDTLVEGTETFTVTLSSPTGGATLGNPATATVSIADNDSPPPQPAGSIQFSASTYSIAENQGTVTITATRTGGTNGTVTVQYFTGPSSATAGADYQAVSGALAWENGDASPKSFTVPIINDTLVEGPETFFVTLNSPTGGATLGAPATATVTITDDDVATGPCGAQGNAWQGNTGAPYNCAGTCSPTPSPQSVTVNGDRVTVTPFDAQGGATFTGCSASLNSDSSTLVYFGQANHRATITRTGNNAFSANIVSSGGGTCSFSCSRAGP